MAVVPLAGDTAIQLESLTVAVHDPPLHPGGPAVSWKFVELPLAGIAGTVAGLTVNVQVGGGGAPA